jgi:putative lipoprotein
MRLRSSVPVLVVVAAIAAACSPHVRTPVAAPAAAPSAPPAAPAPRLVGSSWLLEDLGGRDVIDRVAATLTFPEPGQVAGNGSCNEFTGTVTFNGDAISFSVSASTRMECVPNVVDQEAGYLKALRDAERFEQDELFLTIHYKGGAKPLKFIRASHP